MFVRTLELLEREARKLPPDVAAEVRLIADARGGVEKQLARILEPIDTIRIRCHGDLHLGQVLFTGDDFVVIDFEGEPARPLRERRYKRSPLRDVAGMLRSFSYVAESSLRGGRQRAQDHPKLRPWATSWASWVSAAFLEGYLAAAGSEPFVPPQTAARRGMLDFYTMEKCIYEIGYELASRPAWLPIPIRGLLERVGMEGRA
jgi:maltose alpha-D-glucosyltransferase/alpha-amylase